MKKNVGKLTAICLICLMQITLLAQKTISTGYEMGSNSTNYDFISIYPNPMQGKANVSFMIKHDGLTQINAFSIDGKKIVSMSENLKEGINSFQFSLPKGVYVLQINGNGFSYTGKVISKTINAVKPEIVFNESVGLQTTDKQNNTGKTSVIFKASSSSSYPVLTTNAASLISFTTATSGGDFTSTGSLYVVNKGVCWSTSSGPTTANSTISIGSGSTSYICNLTGLTQSTTYYVRAWAMTTDNAITYGNEINFTTLTPTDPTLTTNAASSITANTAISGGDFTTTGSNHVVYKGICWNTSSGPTTANSKTTGSDGALDFTSNIIGLAQSTTYYVRAWALTTDNITTYGNEINFTTLPARLPTITTTAVSSITLVSPYPNCTAISGGYISSDGGSTVSARGVCWNTIGNPTTANIKTSDGNGAGSFTSSMSGLTLGSTYYVRAYATNGVGTVYGNQISFLCDIIQ